MLTQFVFSMRSVQLLQVGEPRPENGHFCERMPYQVGQATQSSIYLKPRRPQGGV
jgi:hypothetical protein